MLPQPPILGEALDADGLPASPAAERHATPPQPLPPEVGGRDGPEPTRFGDWEKGGRCIDF
jgi:hypothetical protein